MNPKTRYFGDGCIDRLPEILDRLKAREVFLVSGKHLFSRMDELLGKRRCTIFDDFSPNPKMTDVEKGLIEFNRHSFDAVIAVGGGSALDMAKLINIAACHPKNFKDLFLGKLKPSQKGLPLVAVPTTSGSGSQATHFAVVYIDQVKYSVADQRLLPDFCLIDPELTTSMPPRLTAQSGFDALCQAVESFWSIGADNRSQKYAARAIGLIRPAIEKAVHQPNDDARRRCALGAHLAGEAINITKTTAPHALSYPMTTYHKIPHGHAAAILLPRFFTVNSKTENSTINDSRGRDYIKETLSRLCRLFECESAAAFEEKWYGLMDSAGLETEWHALGLGDPADRMRLLRHVNLERLKNNPVMVTQEMLKCVLEID